MQKYLRRVPVFLLLFAVSIVLLQCKWAERKVKEKKDRQTFHKRIVWNDGPRGDCKKEYTISKFNRRDQSRFVHVLASDEKCTLFFQFYQVDTEEDTITYELNKAILVNKDKSIVYDNIEPLKFADIGWGYKIDWSFQHQQQDYAFSLYMRLGRYEDPFLPKD